MRLAWFSPLPPHRSGIAAYSAEAVSQLSRHHQIDAYVDWKGPAPGTDRRLEGIAIHPDHTFVIASAHQPYTVPVYQLGNDLCHHYMWQYLIHYPGLVVLHDAQLHQARARGLLRDDRIDDYVGEFTYSHPGVNRAVADLVVDGLGGSLYFLWPMIRIPLEAARLVGVHNAWLARTLTAEYPQAHITHIRQGVADLSTSPRLSPPEIRRRHGIADDAVVFGSIGRVTPEKGLESVLQAFAAEASNLPTAVLLVVGEAAAYFDLHRQAQELGLADRVIVTGYVQDDDLGSYLTAVDVCLNLRWPTSRETSAAWLRCLAAGRPTIISDLLHLTDVPSVDVRSGRTLCSLHSNAEPICAAIDVLDETAQLRLALRMLGHDRQMRQRLGAAARAYWQREASLDVMTRDYETALTEAARLEAPPCRAAWPAHLTDDGGRTVRSILASCGVALPDFDRRNESPSVCRPGEYD